MELLGDHQSPGWGWALNAPPQKSITGSQLFREEQVIQDQWEENDLIQYNTTPRCKKNTDATTCYKISVSAH